MARCQIKASNRSIRVSGEKLKDAVKDYGSPLMPAFGFWALLVVKWRQSRFSIYYIFDSLSYAQK